MKSHQLTVTALLALGILTAPAAVLAEDKSSVEDPLLYEVDEEDYWIDENYLETDPVPEPPQSEVDVTYFYQELAPYGQWFWTQEHGWVWQPDGLDEEWRPFSYGRWVYSDHGWAWVSYYPWGWAAFHYGAWAHLSGVGWVWVPGVVWSPARVVWRYSGVYVGWAPVIAGYDYWYGWAYYPIHYHHWCFIHWHFFHHHHLHHHLVHHHHVKHVFHKTHYPKKCRDRAGGACHHGPSVKKVAKKTGKAVPWQKVSKPRSPKEARARVDRRPSKKPGIRQAQPKRQRPSSVSLGRTPVSPGKPGRAASTDDGRRSIRERPRATSRTPSRGKTIRPSRPASEPPSRAFKPRSSKVRPPDRASRPKDRSRSRPSSVHQPKKSKPSRSYSKPSRSYSKPSKSKSSYKSKSSSSSPRKSSVKKSSSKSRSKSKSRSSSKRKRR